MCACACALSRAYVCVFVSVEGGGVMGKRHCEKLKGRTHNTESTAGWLDYHG